MKFKMLALILVVTIITWAQNATPTTPSAPQQSDAPAAKDKCPCCDKMAADAKDAPVSCMHHEMKAGESEKKESCCAGKDAMSSDAKGAMSCMKGDKDKPAASCGDQCSKDKDAAARCGGKDCGKDCCSKKGEKTAKSCCEENLHS